VLTITRLGVDNRDHFGDFVNTLVPIGQVGYWLELQECSAHAPPAILDCPGARIHWISGAKKDVRGRL